MQMYAVHMHNRVACAHVTAICEDFCLNDAECWVGTAGVPACKCKDHFTGERCENRLDPKSIKVAYIAGGIGGAVALLILIVIVVWMICFRYITYERSYINVTAQIQQTIVG
jgi:hypothetical protein